jgi:hypothetical protein
VDVPGDEVAKVEWLGYSDLTADELLMGKAVGTEQMDAWDNATEWLRDYLSGGPVPNKHLTRDAASEKIEKDSLQKAKTRLRVRQKKDGFGGQWLTYLPESKASSNGYHAPEGDETF